MKHFLSTLAFFLLLTFALTSAQAQQVMGVDQSFINEYVSKNWTTEDGLPGMTVTSLLQDQKGYIYIGTYDGLVRFDGVEFTVFNRAVDEKYEFASVHALFQDEAGNLWVGHNDEGVTCMEPNGGLKKFTTADGLPNNKINAICEDFSHNIWIGTAVGLCYITPEQEVVVPEMLREPEFQNLLIVRLFCDNVGRIWITTGTENQLYVISNSKIEKYTGITKIENSLVFSVNQDKNGAYWFGVAPHYAIRIKDGEETLYDIGHSHQDGSTVNSIIQDRNGAYWFATDSGLTILQNGMYTYYDTQNGLPDDGLTAILEDKEGNIWIGLNRGGLMKLSLGKFRTVNMGLSVNAICEDERRGVTWIGTDSGVACYKDNQFIENEVTEFCKNLRVRHVGLTKDNELLISTFSLDKPQICVSPQNKIRAWSVDDGIAGNRCRVSIKASNGDIYAGTAMGLTIIQKDGILKTLKRADGLDNDYIMWLYEDSKNQIWVGTNGGGIFILKDHQIVKHYSTDDGLAGNVIFKISEQDDGHIWIGTGTGLSKFYEEENRFANFNSTNGLGTDSVFQLITDFAGNAWMLTNKGILSAKMDDMQAVASGERTKFNVQYYGRSDGLVTGGANSTSYSQKDSHGRIWFTLVDGFAIYDPVKAGKNQIAPQIEIQEYTIDNTTYEYHGEKIVLPPSAKRLSIKFTGLSFVASDKVQFSFRLHGFENEYSDWASIRTVSYTNIKPGTYEFTVMSQNNDGITSEPSVPVIIVKKPYFWQQIWFWVLLVLIIGLVVFSAVQYKIHSMKKYQQELEQKVEERTHDLNMEKEKSERLLLNILPQDVARELTEHPDKTIAKKFPNVTVMFTDIVGFTKMSDGMSAEEVVTMLNTIISRCDMRAKAEGIEKIKTIGDAYMAACGLTEKVDRDGVAKMIRFAQGILKDVEDFNRTSAVKVHMRIGINTGNLIAGVIGKSKFIYDIWGDTVNVASRMESTGEPMRIHVTETTYQQTKDLFTYSEGVDVEVKGKGHMKTFFL